MASLYTKEKNANCLLLYNGLHLLHLLLGHSLCKYAYHVKIIPTSYIHNAGVVMASILTVTISCILLMTTSSFQLFYTRTSIPHNDHVLVQQGEVVCPLKLLEHFQPRDHLHYETTSNYL